MDYRVIASTKKSKKWYKIYGYVTTMQSVKLHLATVQSLGNACMVAEKFAEMPYVNITVE